MRNWKKFTVFIMALCMICTGTLGIFAEDGQQATQWTVSKSKKATNLNSEYQSRVTLSLPSAEEELTADIVFVLDKSTSASVENQITAMLEQLSQQVANTKAKVKAGVVIFNKQANRVCELTDIGTPEGLSAVENAVKTDISSGTNLHAGLLAGKAMLDEDQTVSADHKYLITVSDGITYMYNAEPTATAWGFVADTEQNWAGPENWNSKYGSNNPPADWNAYLEKVGAQVAAQGTTYEYPYGGDRTNVETTPASEAADYANSIDKALYLSYQTYQEAARAGYHCYAVSADTESGAQYHWGPAFMEFLADGSTVSFDGIQREVIYLIEKGQVTDYIGKTDEYDFNMVDQESMVLKVGEQEYQAQAGGAPHVYVFGTQVDGKYPYVVTYYPENGDTEEHFVWEINVPVENFKPVSLSYTVQLMNPKTEAGIYGTYDEDGSAGYEGLYTNNSAALEYTGTDGTAAEEIFLKPTVSYEVEAEPITPPPTILRGDLTVTKTVVGENAETDREFQFTVVLSNSFISGTYGDVTFSNGTASFTLKHGQSKLISGLPQGTGYTVIETAADGYTSSSTGSSGTILYGQTVQADFVNTAITEDPEEPVQPEEPQTPEDPQEPEKPGASQDPQNPEQPSGTDPAQQPDTDQEQNVDLPKTGDESMLFMWLLLAVTTASAAGCIGFLSRRKDF